MKGRVQQSCLLVPNSCSLGRVLWLLSIAVLTVTISLVTVGGGCPPPDQGPNGDSEEVWDPDEFTFDVELASDTVVVDQDHLDLLVESDTENHIYTFEAAGVESSGLELAAGKNLVLHGITVRRITSVETVADNLVVQTEFVPLNEVITDGTIAWDYGVEFTSAKVAALEIPGQGIIPIKEGTPIDVTVTVDDLTYQIQATLDTETSTFTFTVTKELGAGLSARYVAQGQIRRFRSRNTIDFQGGQLQQFDHQLNGMEGDVTLELTVAGSGDDFVNLELPVTIMRIPFTVGFIPVELKIKIQFVINATVPVDGSSRVKANFKYDSDLGFNFDGVDVSAGGRLGSITFGDELHETGASSAIGVNFGMGFPRVELSILGDSVVPWAQTAFLIGGSFTVFPACQTADAQFLGAAGYDLGLFGMTLVSGSKTFFSEKRELLRSGNCPEEKAEHQASGWLLQSDISYY